MPKKTLGFCGAICALLCAAPALAATCTPGYYPWNGTCTICPPYYACPDGDTVSACSEHQYTDPASGATKCLDCPTTILHPDGFERFYDYRGEGGYIWTCRAEWRRRTEHGTKVFSCTASENGYYDNTDILQTKCMLDTVSCDAGYVSILPKNDWGNYRRWFNSYPDASNFEVCVPAGIGYYSADGDLEAIPCPAGTSTHTNTASSVDECAALCTGGVTKFRVGAHSFNLWQNKYTSPALHVRTAGGTVCYINLAPGSTTGTVNISIGGATYHLIN